jgi:hypothetical protein
VTRPDLKLSACAALRNERDVSFPSTDQRTMLAVDLAFVRVVVAHTLTLNDCFMPPPRQP